MNKLTPRHVFSSLISRKAERRLRAKQASKDLGWYGLGMMGLIGWSVVFPTLLGAALGQWIDRRHPGSQSWTLALLVAGLCLGCFNAWGWVAKEDQAMHEGPETDHE